MKSQLSLAILVACVSTPVFSQQVRIAQAQNPQATLPEIEVRPPVVESTPVPNVESTPQSNLDVTPSPSIEGAQPTSPPSTGSALDINEPFQFQPSPNGNTNASQTPIQFGESYPSLSDQTFGGIASSPTGINSIFRGESDLFAAPRMATIVDRETLNQRQASTMFRLCNKRSECCFNRREMVSFPLLFEASQVSRSYS